MGALSSPLAAHTLPEPVPPDTLRPEIIIDLQVTDRGEDWLDLAWTAPADPPESDTVQNYYLAYRPGDPLVTEIDWITSNVISNGLPEPSAPGSPEQYRLTGLDPGIFYGISLRTDDAAGNLSHLSPPFADSTMAEPPPPPPDTLPPYPIDDLAVLYRDTTSVILEWTVPQDQGGSSLASYEIRLSVSSDPIDETTWPSATPYPSSPLPHEPATQQTISWKGLEPGTSYAAAVKTRDMQGNLSELSNPLVFETDTLYIPPEVDETPPSRVDDFRVVSVLTDGFRLLWTMTGDDGMEGLADSMAVALTAGDTPIEDEAAWMGAAKLQDLPSIEPPGTEMQFDLSGLEPESAYALAIRVFDEAGNVSPMSPPLVHRTLALPDTMDPEPIIDLTLAAVGTTFVQLEWTAPGDPDGELQRYILGWKFGDWEPSLRAWELAAKDSTSLPAPSPPGSLETVRLEGLLPDTTYSFQIRCRDAADHLSEEGTVLTIETLPLEDPPDPPDDPPPPGPITDLSLADVGLDWMILTWSAPPDSGDLIISYVLGIYPGSPIEDEAGWESALHLTEGLPPPAPEGAVQSVRIDDISLKNGSGVALRALFNEDSLTALANPLWIDPQTQPPEDPEPPAAVDDLHILSIGPEELVLEWTAPHPGLHGGDVISYELGISPEMITEESWDLVEKIEDPPLPAAPGTMQDWWVGDLTEGTLYIFALKSRSEDLLWSPLSNLLTLTTPQIDAVPPLPPSTLNVQWLEEDLLLLEWPPVNDPYLTGYHVYQRLGAGEFMRVTVEPVSAPRLELTAPTADAPVLYAVTSVNRWGLESALSEETMLYTDAFRLMCPRPHPARASARFQLSLPPAPGGNVQLQAAVYTLSGRRLFMLWNGPVRAGREIELIWDGLSESGRPVTPGFYLLRVRAGNDVRGMKFLLIE
ncbi:MAG: fibronectin type III domain-containing protein, partial [Candidatus Eisenbacteria bacterium]|nr:fibronectin type III domain-containing protein [Candidatus Eisenbacteria bacterium]